MKQEAFRGKRDTEHSIDWSAVATSYAPGTAEDIAVQEADSERRDSKLMLAKIKVVATSNLFASIEG